MVRSYDGLPRYVLFFFTVACIGVGVWFLNAYAEIFNSFFLAVMVVMTASPLGFWLQDHGFPRWLAHGLSILAALSVTLLVGLVLAMSALQVLDMVPEFVRIVAEAQQDATSLFGRFGISLEELVAIVPPEAIERTAIRLVMLTLQSISLFSLVVLIVLFMVIEAFVVPHKLKNQQTFGEAPVQIALGFTNSIRQYVGITSLLGLVGGAVIALVLYLLNIPLAMLWGVLYFVLNFVPMVGFWFALIPPILLASINGGASAAILVFALYMIVSTIINQGVKPAVMRGGLDISPFWSIMSLIIWSTILGPLGLVVGVPLTIALKVLVFEPDVNGRWIANLLGAGLTKADIESLADKDGLADDSQLDAADSGSEPISDTNSTDDITLMDATGESGDSDSETPKA